MNLKIAQDEATFEPPTGNRAGSSRSIPISLVRQQGTWKIQVASFARALAFTREGTMESVIVKAQCQTEGFRRLIKDFSARQFASKEEASDWMNYALSPSSISEAPPRGVAAPLAAQIRRLVEPGGNTAEGIKLYEQARTIEGLDTDSWFFLGMALYDAGGEYDVQALDAFTRAEKLARLSMSQFEALVWQGHMLDLMNQREQAKDRYRRAMEVDYAHEVYHDQYHMKIDGEWIKARLQEPFRRPVPSPSGRG
jgi:hypothetical protein